MLSSALASSEGAASAVKVGGTDQAEDAAAEDAAKPASAVAGRARFIRFQTLSLSRRYNVIRERRRFVSKPAVDG